MDIHLDYNLNLIIYFLYLKNKVVQERKKTCMLSCMYYTLKYKNDGYTTNEE